MGTQMPKSITSEQEVREFEQYVAEQGGKILEVGLYLKGYVFKIQTPPDAGDGWGAKVFNEFVNSRDQG